MNYQSFVKIFCVFGFLLISFKVSDSVAKNPIQSGSTKVKREIEKYNNIIFQNENTKDKRVRRYDEYNHQMLPPPPPPPSCQLQLSTVPIIDKLDKTIRLGSNFSFEPKHVVIKQCVGRCTGQHNFNCQPTYFKKKNVNVTVTEYFHRKTDPISRNVTTNITEHGACKCKCKLENNDCYTRISTTSRSTGIDFNIPRIKTSVNRRPRWRSRSRSPSIRDQTALSSCIALLVIVQLIRNFT